MTAKQNLMAGPGLNGNGIFGNLKISGNATDSCILAHAKLSPTCKLPGPLAAGTTPLAVTTSVIGPSRRDDGTRRNAKGARTHLAASL